MWNKKQKTTAPNNPSKRKTYALYALTVVAVLAVLVDVELNAILNQVVKTQELTQRQADSRVGPLWDIKTDAVAVPTATPTASPKAVQNTAAPKAIAATPKPVTPTTSTYSKGVCTTTPIPKKTIYQNASWIDAGKTESGYEGFDGYIYKCTADSNGNHASEFTAQPINAIILVGTGQPTPMPTPTPVPTAKYTYDEALSMATHTCNGIFAGTGAGNSSSYQVCIATYIKKYGAMQQ